MLLAAAKTSLGEIPRKTKHLREADEIEADEISVSIIPLKFSNPMLTFTAKHLNFIFCYLTFPCIETNFINNFVSVLSRNLKGRR